MTMAYKKAKKVKRKMEIARDKRRIEIHLGTNERREPVSVYLSADEFVIENDTVIIYDNDLPVYANKGAWIHVIDIDNAKVLRLRQEMAEAPVPETESTKTGVLPPLEPA